MRWRADGRELFYVAPGGRMMAVEIQAAGERFEAGLPRFLFQTKPRRLPGAQYDPTPDGQRFLVNALVETGEQPVTLVQNWLAGLKK